MFKERFDIMVKGKSTQDQIASYLVKVILGLRDKENIQQAVRLLGCGSAIPNTILVAEIMRSRIKGLYSISEFESKLQQRNNPNDQQQQLQFFNPAIRIKLTMNPTEDEKLMPGFQEPNEVDDDKHIELFDYVMMYIRNLYFWRGGVKDDQRNNRDNQDTRQNNRDIISNRNDRNERRQDNTRKYQNIQESQANPRKSDDWNRDREQFQQSQNQGTLKIRGRMRDNRNDRNINPQRKNYEQKNEDSEIQNREDKFIKRGEVRNRGGLQKSQN
ncbi:unnamed protein product [Paramecium sonneborni]|uniref:DNA/RNA-binding protein Alba-like domain-containing protein n=1 Tax=Paramecium sonneborni TaxID=65129 RepID=A0A8S1M1I2_9CILI|nr:unnamed protein product [Paramecium sonneborni]